MGVRDQFRLNFISAARFKIADIFSLRGEDFRQVKTQLKSNHQNIVIFCTPRQ